MIPASLFIALLLGQARPVQAQDAPSGPVATTAEGDMRYTDINPQGNQGHVREYDGNAYSMEEFDALLRGGWSNSLLDLGIKDANSRDDSGFLNFTYGSGINLKGNFEELTHREPLTQGGAVINNVWQPNTYFAMASTSPAFGQAGFKRIFQNEEIELSLNGLIPGMPAVPGIPGIRLYAGNWETTSRGNQAIIIGASPATTSLGPVLEGIDRYTREDTFGLDLDVTDKGQVFLENAFRKFQDKSQTLTGYAPNVTAATLTSAALNIGQQDTTSNKVAFRYNVSNQLSVTGGASTRHRINEYNQMQQNNYSGNLSGSYQPSKDFSVTTRLYESASQTRDVNVYPGGTTAPTPALNFLFLKGDLDARYSGLSFATLTASYRPEYTHRANALNWVQALNTSAGLPVTYQNGIIQPGTGGLVNNVAADDTKHNLIGSITIKLPEDMEFELQDHYLKASAAAYENSVTLGNDQTGTLTVPLPENLYLTVSVENSQGENATSSLTTYRTKSDTYMTGMTWSDGKGRGSINFNYALETGQDTIDAWFGYTSTTVANDINAPGSEYNYKNNVLSVSATAKPIKKLTLTGNASYTDSQGAFLVAGIFDPYFQTSAGVSPSGQTIQSLNPTDLRIVRWGVTARYELSKSVALRGSFRQESWIDRYNVANDGRASMFDLGLSAKF
jgi:hypothetical protein